MKGLMAALTVGSKSSLIPCSRRYDLEMILFPLTAMGVSFGLLNVIPVNKRSDYGHHYLTFKLRRLDYCAMLLYLRYLLEPGNELIHNMVVLLLIGLDFMKKGTQIPG